MARKVSPRPEGIPTNVETERPSPLPATTPSGIPASVVTPIPHSSAPRTFSAAKPPVTSKPNTARPTLRGVLPGGISPCSDGSVK